MADAQAMTIPEQAVQEYKPTINELLNELKCRLESPPEMVCPFVIGVCRQALKGGGE